jgi:hypothetical protein
VPAVDEPGHVQPQVLADRDPRRRRHRRVPGRPGGAAAPWLAARACAGPRATGRAASGCRPTRRRAATRPPSLRALTSSILTAEACWNALPLLLCRQALVSDAFTTSSTIVGRRRRPSRLPWVERPDGSSFSPKWRARTPEDEAVTARQEVRRLLIRRRR